MAHNWVASARSGLRTSRIKAYWVLVATPFVDEGLRLITEFLPTHLHLYERSGVDESMAGLVKLPQQAYDPSAFWICNLQACRIPSNMLLCLLPHALDCDACPQPAVDRSPRFIDYPNILPVSFSLAVVVSKIPLKQQLFNLDLHGVDRRLELRDFVRRNRAGNDRTRDATRTAQGDFAIVFEKAKRKQVRGQWSLNSGRVQPPNSRAIRTDPSIHPGKPTSEQRHREHSYLHTARANAREFQWVQHPPP
jgi:hypothetical protein